jgi:hypothetical protein
VRNANVYQFGLLKNFDGGRSLKTHERYKRPAALCLAALGILLWSNTVDAAFGSLQKAPSVTKRNQKATASKSGVLVERFSFSIKDFKINHQGEDNVLNITISYRYKAHLSTAEYPDFTLIARDIETLLTNYPNKEDYWEILNKKITLMVLEKYPAITKITSQVQVSPSPKNSYLRSSIVTRDRTTLKK